MFDTDRGDDSAPLIAADQPRARRAAVRLRLIVALPILIALLFLTAGLTAKALVDLTVDAYSTRTPEMRFAEGYAHNILFIAVPFAALGGLAIAYIILSPLRRISREIDNVASGGIAHAFNIPPGDEIGSLGESINKMIQNMTRYLPERERFIFHNLASGVITFNHQGMLTSINSAADQMLQLQGVGINGRMIREYFRQFGDLDELVEVLIYTLTTKKDITNREVHIYDSDGERRTLSVTTAIVAEPNSESFEVLVTLIDLTQMKEVSKRMIESDKLSAIGSLAAGVAHEVRNPLGTLKGLSQLLLENPQFQAKEREYLEMIVSESDRLNEVVNRLLDFSRPTQEEFAATDLNALMERARDLARHKMKSRGITLTEKLATDLPPVDVNSKRLLQALLNLILNAAEATGANGNVTLSTLHDARRQQVLLRILNTGSSILPEERVRIFHPFYTTKDGGTGLGLAITSQIIHEHGGRISVEEPQPNETQFTIALPIYRALPRREIPESLAAGGVNA